VLLSVDEETPPTLSDELKKVIMHMKNNEATGTGHLQSFKCGGND